MLVGVVDPIGLLSLAPEDWDIACVTVGKAREIQTADRIDEWKGVTKRIGAEVGAAVAVYLAHLLRRP